jgi:hypothetical protein
MTANLMMTEALPREWSKWGSCVAWAWKPHAFVFVHGFGGHAVDTWGGFRSLIAGSPELAGWDVFFYGYDGVHARAQTSASIFRQFLTNTIEDPEHTYRSTAAAPAARSNHPEVYEKIILVCHSLGSAVARRALLQLYQLNPRPPWVANIELALYAPAHAGASTLDWLRASPLAVLSTLIPLGNLLGKLSVLNDLKPSSVFLSKLAEDVIAEYESGGKPNLRAKKVVHAEYDSVVDVQEFPPDPPPVIIQGTDHCSVCKPTFDFPRPFDELAGIA